MSDNIVPFAPPRKPAEVWVCACGCSTFFLRGDGEAECAGCETVVTGPAGRGWWDRVEHGPDAPPEAPHIIADGVGDFAQAKAKREAAEAGTCWLICGGNGGRVTAWSQPVEGDDEREWLRGRVLRGLGLLLGEAE